MTFSVLPSPYLRKEANHGVLFLIRGVGVRDLVYIMLKTKVTPYVVPTESHYDNVSVRKFLIAQLRNGTESQNTDTSKFSAISVWFFFLCQGEKKKK